MKRSRAAAEADRSGVKPGAAQVRLVGSRLPLDYALDTGANLVTPAALQATRDRTAYTEAHQSFDHQRLWADLLSSTALSFNLFGDLAADHAYLNSLRAFATAFIVDLDDGNRGIVAVDVKYHERNQPETPRPDNLARYIEVAERSGVFAPGAIDALKRRGDLCVMWLEHLLMLSMLQYTSGNWTWGRYVVVHPAGNSDIVDACARYRAMLADESTFATMTLEQVLDSGTLPRPTVAALRNRYVPDHPA